jgi:hypothetical protein
LGKRQTYAPFEKLHRALDVGCGTGLWAIDFGTGNFLRCYILLTDFDTADAHPETQVMGVDLAPVQPIL